MMRVPLSVRIVRHYFDEQGYARPNLAQELLQAESMVDRLVKVKIMEHKREALKSLLADFVCYEKNVWSFADSGLLKEINAGHFQLAAAEFLRFASFCREIDERIWRKRCCEQTLFSRSLLLFS